jgi:hypothetical protein
MSNKFYNEKKEKYQCAIETRANTNYIFMKYSTWNIDSIEANHQRTINLLMQYYEGNSLKTFLQIKKNLNSNSII